MLSTRHARRSQHTKLQERGLAVISQAPTRLIPRQGKSHDTVFTASPLQPTHSVDRKCLPGSSHPLGSNDQKHVVSIYYLYIIYRMMNTQAHAQGRPFPHCRWQSTAEVSIIDVKQLFSIGT